MAAASTATTTASSSSTTSKMPPAHPNAKNHDNPVVFFDISIGGYSHSILHHYLTYLTSPSPIFVGIGHASGRVILEV
jgi:hypothetical protein